MKVDGERSFGGSGCIDERVFWFCDKSGCYGWQVGWLVGTVTMRRAKKDQGFGVCGARGV
jgi:hypothetical protein